MKKYLLIGLLTFVGLFGAFTSANTVGNFSSSSDICVLANSESFNGFALYDIYNASDSPCFIDNNEGPATFYVCISTEDVPYNMQSWGYVFTDNITVNSSNYCFPSAFDSSSDSDLNIDKTVFGSAYVSASPITYTPPSSGGGNGGGSIGDINVSGGILSGGLTTLGSVLTSLSTAINEFIPYMVYLGLGILIVTLGFIAIKWLVNYTSIKVTGIFSSRRRK